MQKNTKKYKSFVSIDKDVKKELETGDKNGTTINCKITINDSMRFFLGYLSDLADNISEKHQKGRCSGCMDKCKVCENEGHRNYMNKKVEKFVQNVKI